MAHSVQAKLIVAGLESSVVLDDIPGHTDAEKLGNGALPVQNGKKVAKGEPVAAGALSASKELPTVIISVESQKPAAIGSQKPAAVGSHKPGNLWGDSGNRNTPELSPPGEADVSSFMLIASKLSSERSEQMLKTIVARLDVLKEALKEKNVQKVALIEKQRVDYIKEQEAAKSKAFWGFVGKVFAAIASVVVAAAGIAATVASGGLAAPGLMIAGAVISSLIAGAAVVDAGISGENWRRVEAGRTDLLSTSDQLLAQGIAKGLEACGVSEEMAAQVGGYVAMGVIIALSIASTVMTCGGSAGTLVGLIQRGIKISQAVTTVGTGAAQVGQSIQAVRLGELQKDLAKIEAAIKRVEAYSVADQQKIAELQKQIEDIMNEIAQLWQRYTAIIAGQGEATAHQARNIV